MGVLVDETTRVLVQGITGREGSFHARGCMAYGTNVVAGVTPGRGGTMFDDTVPVFNSVEEAVAETQANMSLIFVPPAFAPDAISETADAGIPLIACITEGIPVQDMVKVYRYIENKPTRLIGPNCPGLITPGAKCKIGIMPGAIHLPGRVGVLSRSGTLTYEAVGQLTALDLGQSSCVGIGGDQIIGTNFVDVLRLFDEDPGTDAVVMIGEIGGTMEQDAAAFIKSDFSKPVAALVVGASAPPGKRMGHAGAIISGGKGKASDKIAALNRAGVPVAESPGVIGKTFADHVPGLVG